jgi:hypothetical protein
MPKAIKLYPQIDILNLKKKGLIDANSEKLLKKFIKQNKNILILGNHVEDTHKFLQGVTNHAFRLDHEPLVVPNEQKINHVGSFFASKKWKDTAKMTRGHRQSLFSLNYKGKFEDLYPHLKKVGSSIDVVIDLRHLGKKGKVCQIYEKNGRQWNLPYLNDKHFDPIKMKFVS